MKTVLPEWAKSSVIYEVNIRQYTPEGTINAFSNHIPRLKEMGVDILWIMPIFPISESKRKGSLGSYYAVSDFKAVNPLFGTKEDMINLIDKVHAYGMKIILDWVPNHTGWDHHWIKTNPEFYQKDSSGHIIDPINDEGVSHGWSDVAALDYKNPSMRKAMIDDLIYWVKNHNIDGYRMDIAFGPPHDFWKQFSDTIRNVKPDIFLLAEAEDPTLNNEGWFNTSYGWSFHHLMNAIAKGEKNVNDLRSWRQHELKKFKQGTLMHFTSNHDENSWNGTERERMGYGHRTFAVLCHFFDGIPLIYSGQEEPLERRLAFFEKDDIAFKKYEYAEFYTRLNQIKKENEALYNDVYGGEIIDMTNSQDIYAFKREKNGNKVVVFLNLTSQDRSFIINDDTGDLRNVFSFGRMNYKVGDQITLRGWEFMIGVKDKS
ncbi:MAG TPA: alpha-amylase family glycosyl hydrolase [Saprospiraceae bacterium]|nr:alpha-amylase family glycosyl hydrolase [Saprospiraceae bacterium]